METRKYTTHKLLPNTIIIYFEKDSFNITFFYIQTLHTFSIPNTKPRDIILIKIFKLSIFSYFNIMLL